MIDFKDNKSCECVFPKNSFNILDAFYTTPFVALDPKVLPLFDPKFFATLTHQIFSRFKTFAWSSIIFFSISIPCLKFLPRTLRFMGVSEPSIFVHPGPIPQMVVTMKTLQHHGHMMWTHQVGY